MSARACLLMPLWRIRPTEEVCPRRVDEVIAMIGASRSWTMPICIERTVGALLDGHHRFAAAAAIGFARVPVHVFDYAEVELSSWRPDIAPTRVEVVSRALSGQLYPPKTTRHTFAISAIRPIPISALIDGDISARFGGASLSNTAVSQFRMAPNYERATLCDSVG